jgi:integrase
VGNELEYVVEASPKLSPRSKKNYLRAVRSFVGFAGTDWTGIAVERWRDHLLVGGRKPQTVNLYLAGLRFASRRRAERGNNAALDFARYAETLRPDQPAARRALTYEEGAAFIGACEGERPIDLRDMAIAVLGFRTGLRRAGICTIHFEDFSANVINVTLKGGKKHAIYLDTETVGALGAWGDWLGSQGVHTGPFFRSLSRPQLSGETTIGDSLTADGLLRAMKRRAQKAGIAGFHPHIFRHTCISWLRNQGVPGWRIAQLTGHRSDGVNDPAMIGHYTTDLDGATDPVSGHIPSLRRH